MIESNHKGGSMNQQPNQQLIIPILHFAFVLSVLILIGVGFTVAPDLSTTEVGDDGLLKIILPALGVGLVAASFVVKKLLLNAAAASGGTKGAGIVLTAFIIALALRESGAIMGFALTMMSGETDWVVYLGGLAIAAIIVDWPTKQRLEKLSSDSDGS